MKTLIIMNIWQGYASELFFFIKLNLTYKYPFMDLKTFFLYYFNIFVFLYLEILGFRHGIFRKY